MRIILAMICLGLAGCASIEDRRMERVLDGFDIHFTSHICAAGPVATTGPVTRICAEVPEGGMRIDASSRGDVMFTRTVILINDRDEAVAAGLTGFGGNPPRPSLKVLDETELAALRQYLEEISVCDLPVNERISIGGGTLAISVLDDRTGQTCGGHYAWGNTPGPEFLNALEPILHLSQPGPIYAAPIPER